MPIWNKDAECASNEARQALQLARLQQTVERVYARVPFYRDKLDRAGVNPDSITSLKDIAKLPFTTQTFRVANPALLHGISQGSWVQFTARHIGGENTLTFIRVTAECKRFERCD